MLMKDFPCQKCGFFKLRKPLWIMQPNQHKGDIFGFCKRYEVVVEKDDNDDYWPIQECNDYYKCGNCEFNCHNKNDKDDACEMFYNKTEED